MFSRRFPVRSRSRSAGLVRFLGTAVVAIAWAPGCASPTLPLPPPEEPTLSSGEDGDHVNLSAPCGGAEPSAEVIVLNTNPTVANDEALTGTVADTCGAWEVLNVFAHEGDVLQITQTFGGVTSGADLVEVGTP